MRRCRLGELVVFAKKQQETDRDDTYDYQPTAFRSHEQKALPTALRQSGDRGLPLGSHAPWCQAARPGGPGGRSPDFLGREHYERRSEDGPFGYRNGYRDRTIKTAEERLQVRRPRVRDTDESFESRLLTHIEGLEQRIQQLAVEMYVRGLSTRDIEETLVDQGGNPLISRSSVGRVCERLHEEYETFSERDLSKLDEVYLLVDGVYEAVRDYTRN